MHGSWSGYYLGVIEPFPEGGLVPFCFGERNSTFRFNSID
jgi:hypothetical protein